MYLLIHDDGSLQAVKELQEDVFDAASDGYVEIVDISGDVPLLYKHNAAWVKIKST